MTKVKNLDGTEKIHVTLIGVQTNTLPQGNLDQ
jgi:hypothetical protein